MRGCVEICVSVYYSPKPYGLRPVRVYNPNGWLAGLSHGLRSTYGLREIMAASLTPYVNMAKIGFFCPSIFRRHVREKVFQDKPRRVAKFRENRPRDVEKICGGKKR